MDEKREERQKESIDEILSDLNGLLNKMPAILEGIKLPDVKPVDFLSPRMPEPAVPASVPVIRPETTPEPAAIPAPAAAKLPEPEAADEPAFTRRSPEEDLPGSVIKPEESRPPEAVIPEEKDKLAPQSLGEYMFSRNAQPEPESPAPLPGPIEPAGLDSSPELPEIKPVMDGIKPEAFDPGSLMEEETAIESAFKREPEKEEEKSEAPFEGTRDFGVPDIDTLIRLSQEEALPRSFGRGAEVDGVALTPVGDSFAPEGRGLPAEQQGRVERVEAEDGGILNPALCGAVPDEEPEKQAEPMLVTGPADDTPAQPEPVPAPVFETEAAPEAEPQPALEPASENIIAAPRAGSAEEEEGDMDIKKENSGTEEPSKPSGVIEGALPGQIEPVKQESPVPEAEAGAAAGPRIELSSPQEFTLKASGSGPEEQPCDTEGQYNPSFNPLSGEKPPSFAPELSPGASEGGPAELLPGAAAPAPEGHGLVIEQTSSVFNPAPPAAASGDDDKTMVIPPSSTRPEDEKTVIYEAGADPGVISRGRGDLGSLSDKPVPDGIPPERVRTVAFLYAQEDAGLCADVLAELDAICLKSPSNPMFIKRGFVSVCVPGISGTVYMQKVADAGAVGLVCVGNVPQETIYEVENVFTAGGVFFRHFPREAFSHSAALDLVAEFILK